MPAKNKRHRWYMTEPTADATCPYCGSRRFWNGGGSNIKYLTPRGRKATRAPRCVAPKAKAA